MIRNTRLAILLREVAAFQLNHPEATEDEVLEGVANSIRGKYRSGWAIVLISLLEALLPFILAWLNEEEDE